MPLLSYGQSVDKGLLWKITGKNITAPTYLFGTLHLFDTTQYELPGLVFQKLTQVHNIYFELDFGHIDATAMANALWIRDTNMLLTKLLDKRSVIRLKKIAAASPTLRILGRKIFELKPFYVSAFLLTAKNQTSIDMELYKAAVISKDSIYGLETMAEQLKAVDAISLKAQARMLEDLLKTFHSSKDLMAGMTRIYIGQDIDKIPGSFNHALPTDVSFNTELVLKRNLVMCYRILNLLGHQSMLIAVGAGHLGGPSGLVKMLRNAGYTVTPVPFKFRKH